MAILAEGVRFVHDTDTHVQWLEIDLRVASVRPVVVAQNIRKQGNNYVGDSHTVLDWARLHNAIGGINGGFFGETYDSAGTRKQIVQLTVVGQNVVTPGSSTLSTRIPGERYLRSAIGFLGDGQPQIVWASGNNRVGAQRSDSAINPTRIRPWNVHSAVACGPRLFHTGQRRIADRQERLVSPGKVPRVFVAYDGDGTRATHLILGRADAMDYSDIADFLETHFRKTYGAPVREAMCLDGGSSAQMVYRFENREHDIAPTGVRVPTALLLLPTNSPRP